jgi:antitoxin HicB
MTRGRAARAGKVSDYAERPYRVTLLREDADGVQRWVATVEELPGCTSTGKTRDEAAAGVQDAIAAWVADALEQGREIPEPRATATSSGRLLLRMPRTLHAELTRAAEREGVSLNQLITDLLSSAVNWQRGPDARGTASKPKTSLTQEPGEDGLTAQPAARYDRRPRNSPSLLVVALAANFVVVVLAAIVAIIVLISTWL